MVNSAVTVSGGSAAWRTGAGGSTPNRRRHQGSGAGGSWAAGRPRSATWARTRCRPGVRPLVSRPGPLPSMPSREEIHRIPEERSPSSTSAAAARSFRNWPRTRRPPSPPPTAVPPTERMGERLSPRGMTSTPRRSRLSSALVSTSCRVESARATMYRLPSCGGVISVRRTARPPALTPSTVRVRTSPRPPSVRPSRESTTSILKGSVSTLPRFSTSTSTGMGWRRRAAPAAGGRTRTRTLAAAGAALAWNHWQRSSDSRSAPGNTGRTQT